MFLRVLLSILGRIRFGEMKADQASTEYKPYAAARALILIALGLAIATELSLNNFGSHAEALKPLELEATTQANGNGVAFEIFSVLIPIQIVLAGILKVQKSWSSFLVPLAAVGVLAMCATVVFCETYMEMPTVICGILLLMLMGLFLLMGLAVSDWWESLTAQNDNEAVQGA